MEKSRKKILLVMPLSTMKWGSSNAGGVDSVCQIISEYLTNNTNPNYHYRIVAISLLQEPKAFSGVVRLSDNVELIWIPRKKLISNRVSVPSLFYYMYKVRQQVREYQPNLIHSHLWAAILGCQRSIPSIVTVHSYKDIGRTHVSTANDWLYVKLLPYIYKYFGHRIVAVGNALKHTLSLDVSQPVLAISNPIDSEYFKNVRFVTKDNKIKLVTCALLNPKKQVEKIITLIGLLVKSGIDCQLNIIGPTSDSKYICQLKGQVEQEQLTNSVSFLGRLDKAQIINCYQQSDIGVFLSREETFGLAPLEMLASGLPVLATCVGVLAEEKGYFSSVGVTFVDADDNSDLLERALELLADMRAPDTESLQKKFAVSAVVAQYDKIYSELLGS